MRKLFMLFSSLFLFSIIFSGLLNPVQAAGNEQEIKPFAIGNPIYPNSTLEMQPGDVLYTSKGWSTGLVGHVAIVGTDFKLKEVLTGSPAGKSVTLNQFWGRHSKGNKISIHRPSKGAAGAARWATNNIGSVTKYNLTNHNINTISTNYCSKFVLQAFYHGSNISLVASMNTLTPPSNLKNSSNLRLIATLTVN